MSKCPKLLVILLPVLFTSSCAGTADRNLSPPPDTQWVNVEIKNPSQYTKPFPLEVVYISHKCLKSSINGIDGSREEKPSYNGVKIPLQQQGDSDLWHAKVAMNGGGSCDWKLSEFDLGIEYIDATHLGDKIVPGTAVGATIAFDDTATRNGKFDNITKNILTYNPKYYPLIKRWSETKNSKQLDKLYLFGKEGAFWDVYMHIDVNNPVFIKFHPVVYEGGVVELKFPYEKYKGAMFEFIYPNGEHVSSKDSTPDFNKLEGLK